jgi:hypothetical protein
MTSRNSFGIISSRSPLCSSQLAAGSILACCDYRAHELRVLTALLVSPPLLAGGRQDEGDAGA